MTFFHRLRSIPKSTIAEFITISIIIMFFSWSFYFFCTQGTYKFLEFQQGTYYHQLALAFAKGMLGIPGSGPGADWSYYKGVNYLYFGPLPVIVWIALKNIGHLIISFTELTLIVAIINLILFYFLLTVVNRYFFSKSSNFIIKIILFVIYGLGPLYFLSARYFVYETAIIFGSTNLIASFLFFSVYFNSTNKNKAGTIIPLFLSGVFLALSFLSRANLILAVLPMSFFIFYKECIIYRKKLSYAIIHKLWFILSFFLIPIVIGIVLYSYYNILRYGNPIEFGMKYNSPGIEEARIRTLNNATVSLNYFILNIRQLVSLIPGMNLNIPFIQYPQYPNLPSWLVGSFPKLVAVEYTSSIFYSSPILLAMIYIPFWIFRKFRQKIKESLNIFLILSILVAVSIYGLFFMGYARRYYQDYYFLIVLLSFLGMGFLWKEYVVRYNMVIKTVFCIGIVIIIGWTYLLALNLNCQFAFKNDYERCLSIYNKQDTFVHLN